MSEREILEKINKMSLAESRSTLYESYFDLVDEINRIKNKIDTKFLEGKQNETKNKRTKKTKED